jgi:phospholipid/cholesterol/gamma-HCH transport system ATP-binding protein
VATTETALGRAQQQAQDEAEDRGRQNGQPEVEIAVKDLTKSFGPQTVLEDITCDIPKGKITLMLGPSGTGKSVFLKHLMGLLKPDRGEIWIDGKNLPKLSAKELYQVRRKFGVLFQDGALFGSMSVYDNVAFPLREHTKKRESEIKGIAMEKLEMVGLVGAEQKLPGEISGGMKKRAGLARALVLDPEIVLFDEPDSGLDPVRTAFLNELILDLNRQLQATFLVVTHDIATAKRIADYIGMLYRRNLVRFGPAREMFESDQPEVRQFLAGDTTGPIGMSEEADQTKAQSSSGMSAEETERMEREAGAPDEGDGPRGHAAPPRPDRDRDASREDESAPPSDVPPRPDRRAEAREGQQDGDEEPRRPSEEAKAEGDRRQQEAEEAMDRAKDRMEGEPGGEGSDSPLDDFHRERASREGADEEGSQARREGT